MADKDLRDLLEGLFSDLPTEPDAPLELTPAVRPAGSLGPFEEMLLHVVDHMRDAVLVTDREGTIRFANAAAERAMERAETDLPGKAVGTLLTDTHEGEHRADGLAYEGPIR
jgi:PAS domain-containing protein